MNYQYVAYTKDWKIVKGTLSVASEAVAEQTLIRQGYQPISVKSMAAMPSIEQLFPSLFTVKPKEVIMFARQLSTLLEASISLVPGLQMLQEQITNRLFKKVVGTMLDDIRAGNSFSDALTKHSNIFGEVFCKLVAVGEQTGSLEISLKQASNYIEKEVQAKKKIKRALTYPIIVLAVAIVVIGVLVIFVLPSMMSMFTSMNAELPITTKMLVAIMNFVESYKLYLFGAVVLSVVGLVVGIRQPKARYQLDRLLITLPVIGTVNLMNEMARFCQTITLLLHAGLPLPDIINMTRQTSSNRVIQNALNDVQNDLIKGEGLSVPMSKHSLFPHLLVQMVMVGEESGNLESTMSIVAESYESEADDKISGLIALIEPAMTIGLALMVAFIALSVISPMYSIMGAFG
ncbi:MAG: type II secretion system F family protein [Dehalococcoidales bacterium]|nr:MAG: type II secretion system F family protein [Dehalococcoidales bacterium]